MYYSTLFMHDPSLWKILLCKYNSSNERTKVSQKSGEKIGENMENQKFVI